MKIIRHETTAGPAYAALFEDGKLRPIVGDLFGSFDISDRTITPGKRLAPVVPTNIIGIGLNYRKHAEETGKAAPAQPMWFMKTTGSVQNPDEAIVLPVAAASSKVDYEGELAVVIGRACKNVGRDDALSYVLGYTIANDVSARDWQFEWGGGQFCQGKSFDTFCPLGPALVTTDEIANPNALRLKTTLNGEVVQDWTTADMIFDVPAIISFLSRSRTLPAGTVILTGTPHGVGAARKPPLWLREGNTVSVEIEQLGVLTNPIRLEQTN